MEPVKYTTASRRVTNENNSGNSTNPMVTEAKEKLKSMDFVVYGITIVFALGAVYVLTRKNKK